MIKTDMIGNCEVQTTTLKDGGASLVITGSNYRAQVSVTKGEGNNILHSEGWL